MIILIIYNLTHNNNFSNFEVWSRYDGCQESIIMKDPSHAVKGSLRYPYGQHSLRWQEHGRCLNIMIL